MQLDEILRKRRIIITSGTGGVGKTTISAALGIRAALLGKRVLVITIDPAKRLVTSLGLNELGDQAAEITPALSSALSRVDGLPKTVNGKLWATMPDTRKTFDRFMESLSPSPETVQKVLRNPLYNVVATEFSGANEYMSLQALDQAFLSSEYDCIIMDTPPNRNTLAFLDASRLLTRLFEERLIRWLVVPANKLVHAGMKKVLGALEGLTGAGFIGNLIEFASALFEVQGNFTRKLSRISKLLESEQVGFVMVTSPTPDTIPELMHLIGTLEKRRYRFDGVILNRTLSEIPSPEGEENERPDLARAFSVFRSLRAREEGVQTELERALAATGASSGPFVLALPELIRDVHSLEDLLAITSRLGKEFAP